MKYFYTVHARNSANVSYSLVENSNGRTMCPLADSIAYHYPNRASAQVARNKAQAEWQGLHGWTIEKHARILFRAVGTKNLIEE